MGADSADIASAPCHRRSPRRRGGPQGIEQREPVAAAIEHLRHRIILAALAEELFAIPAKHEISQLARCLDASGVRHLHQIRVPPALSPRLLVQRRRHQMAVLQITYLQAQFTRSLHDSILIVRSRQLTAPKYEPCPENRNIFLKVYYHIEVS